MTIKFISSKPYKQWCKARGIDFISYMQQFPLLLSKLNIQKIKSVVPVKKRLTLREKVKAFFTY